ncbi:MAG: hypothetical protein EXS51_00265 [Candidatus Taylorbacteria bacterium]|nr:hypothetical protein [Candidatus Taylorbacteria bacterium]
MKFKVWRTVKVGTYPTCADLEKAVNGKCGGRTWFSSLPFIIQPAGTLELTLVKGFQLGQRRNASRKEICELAKRARLQECPNEVAVQLVLQDFIDPYTFETNIGSTEKLGDRSDCYMSVNSRLGMVWLNCYVDQPEGFEPSIVWVFVVPQTEKSLAV